jgi:hypothetical protein
MPAAEASNDNGASIRYDEISSLNIADLAMVEFTIWRWGTSTPLGWPVEPDV